MPRRKFVWTLVFWAVVVGSAVPAAAQGRWRDRVRITASAGLQPGTSPLTQNIILERYVEDNGFVRVEAPKAGVPLFDFGGVVRLVGNFGAGVSMSLLATSTEAEVEAEIPHPLFFDQPRPISGTAAIEHAERAIHANAVYMIVSRRVDVALFGGASFFKLEQDVVTDVAFSEVYPYDTAEFTSATVRRADASVTGYNAGADITWRMSPRWGVGGLVRFTRATLPITASGIDFGEVEVGGVQAAAGLRLMF